MRDWDNDIDVACREYLAACYGQRELPIQQRKEVLQAFLSGIHWLNTDGGGSAALTDAVARKLKLLGCLP